MTVHKTAAVSAIVKKGYKVDYNLKAATYDFRLSPSGLRTNGFYRKLKELIESLVVKFERRVVLVVHSMGNPILNFFLKNEVNQEWKDRHIKVWTAIAPAFMGAPKSLKARGICVTKENSVIKKISHLGSNIWRK